MISILNSIFIFVLFCFTLKTKNKHISIISKFFGGIFLKPSLFIPHYMISLTYKAREFKFQLPGQFTVDQQYPGNCHPSLHGCSSTQFFEMLPHSPSQFVCLSGFILLLSYTCMSFPQLHIPVFFFLPTVSQGRSPTVCNHAHEDDPQICISSSNCSERFKIPRSFTCIVRCYLHLSIPNINSSSSFRSPVESNHLLCFPFLMKAQLRRHGDGDTQNIFSFLLSIPLQCVVLGFSFFIFYFSHV